MFFLFAVLVSLAAADPVVIKRSVDNFGCTEQGSGGVRWSDSGQDVVCGGGLLVVLPPSASSNLLLVTMQNNRWTDVAPAARLTLATVSVRVRSTCSGGGCTPDINNRTVTLATSKRVVDVQSRPFKADGGNFLSFDAFTTANSSTTDDDWFKKPQSFVFRITNFNNVPITVSPITVTIDGVFSLDITARFVNRTSDTVVAWLADASFGSACADLGEIRLVGAGMLASVTIGRATLQAQFASLATSAFACQVTVSQLSQPMAAISLTVGVNASPVVVPAAGATPVPPTPPPITTTTSRSGPPPTTSPTAAPTGAPPTAAPTTAAETTAETAAPSSTESSGDTTGGGEVTTMTTAGGAPASPTQMAAPTDADFPIVPVAAGIGGALAVVCIAAAIVVVLMRRTKKSVALLPSVYESGPLGPENGVYVDIIVPKRTSEGALHIALDEIELGQKLGEGQFGVVFKGKWHGKAVAVKQFKAGVMGGDKAMAEFEAEVSNMATIPFHENLVQLHGVTTLENGDMAAVVEFCANGALVTALYGEKARAGWTLNQLQHLAHGAACGLAHLHRLDVVHRDIAARNVLLTRHDDAKIADFGMARLVPAHVREAQTASLVGPIKWMAPEQIERRAYSKASDVFSFGVLLFEIFEREAPWSGLSNVDVAHRVRSGERMDVATPRIPRAIGALVIECWAAMPMQRPAMEHVQGALEIQT